MSIDTFCKFMSDIYKEIVKMSDYLPCSIDFDSVYSQITCEFI